MQRKVIALLFIIGFASHSLNAQKRVFCEQIQNINRLIDIHHIQPKAIDDSLSADVWNNFIKALDPDRAYFLESDIKNFESDKYQLDEYFNNEKCKFIKPYIKVLEDRLSESRKLLENFYKVDFNYPASDSLFFDSKREKTYSKDEKDRYEDLLRLMKYKTISEAINRFDDKEKFLQGFDSIKAEVKRFTLDRSICSINEIQEHQGGFDVYVYELFLNALSNVYDPNTVYFNNSEKNTFGRSYSSNSQSFGIWTDKNESGQIVISYVNSNSHAAIDKLIETGDVLRSVKSGRDKLNTACISNQEVINFLNDDEHQTAEFEIEKSRGQIKTISLTKTNIPVEYNAVDVLIADEDVKLAYMNIPSFYVNNESRDWRGTSLDVGKALYKIMQDNVEGLLIDLRQNSGGAMKEAADLSNLFVDGPVAVLKQKDQRVTIFNNKKAQVFNKPIVIMVDAYTASAAELFAGIMQDYGKAIIVGNKTYGKATSQSIFPLDENNESLGHLKVTLEKFYRVSGKSHQKTGIIPDINLPHILKDIIPREKDEIHALNPDTIAVDMSFRAFDLPIEKLKLKSEKRLKNNEEFTFIQSSNEALKSYIKDKKTAYPFQPEYLYDDIMKYENLWNDIYNHFENKTYLNFSKTTYDKKYEKVQDLERLKNLMKFTSEDIIVHESIMILKDWIEIQKQKNL